MDCNSARLFLHFRRPDSTDLDGVEAMELEDHLAHCSECNMLARNERRLDQSLGRAMRDVDVPTGLRAQILDRLSEQRSHAQRRWLRSCARGALAAMLLLAVGLGSYYWFTQKPRYIDPEQVVTTLSVTQPSTDTVNASLKRLGDRPNAPSFLNWAYLASAPAIAELPGPDHQGVMVPQLVFRKVDDKGRNPDRFAIVYILDKNRILIDDQARPNSGYKYAAEVYEHEGCNFLVLYTGDSWAWLKSP